MNKQDLLNLVGKGVVKIGDIDVELSITNSIGSDYLHIKQLAINEFTTDRECGGFVDYITDADVLMLEGALLDARGKMLRQAGICKKAPLELTSVDGRTLVSASKKRYEVQNPANDHFEIYTLCHGEADCPINCPVSIDGELYLPVWSWWLDRGCYLVKGHGSR
jgi:hypothetical protein